jgi:hypothetical protein
VTILGELLCNESHKAWIADGEVLGPLKVADVVEQHHDGRLFVVELCDDDEGLLEQALGDADGRDVGAVELIEEVDVRHNAPLVLLRQV